MISVAPFRPSFFFKIDCLFRLIFCDRIGKSLAICSLAFANGSGWEYNPVVLVGADVNTSDSLDVGKFWVGWTVLMR